MATVSMVGSSPTFSQQEPVVVETSHELSGEVLSVDQEESNIVVKYLKDSSAETYEAEMFQVAPSTEMIKAGAKSDLAEIKLGDQVFLKYSEDEGGVKILISLSIE